MEKNVIIYGDHFGNALIVSCKAVNTMLLPVKCNHCGQIYDLGDAKVNHRFADCDQFTTPCCGYRFADTRTWKSFPDYKEIKK